ncbi:MAG TPA: polyprenol monophosphomannose synthase [Chlorobaculum parvum]|uniref:Polyprenol monophosphomannose synthase n=1 Tax=Chlorobaculum parvum TaxID=274539 RepID=A0A7C5HIL1_9CHLB|nr:polyprenol monophosphomannose synthase [Chlorobaculum parvum]
MLFLLDQTGAIRYNPTSVYDQSLQNPAGKTLVIIPTYNEAENIESLILTVLERYSENLDMLVIDDSSPDGTGVIVEKIAANEPRVTLLKRPGKLGLGTAYLMGFRYALENGYERIIEMDADFSHDPASIASLIDGMERADLVIGSRYMNNTVNVVNWPLSRLILSKTASIYTRLITGMPVSDPTSGFKCLSRKTLKTISLDRIHSQGYSFQIEINFRVWKQGFTIHEVPIIFVDRTVGKSKMTRKNIVEAVWMVWWLKLLSIVGRL